MSASYTAAHLDDIAAEKWPYWAPIRHHFDIRSFGINAWRGADGDEVIKQHAEGEGGHEELYVVFSGHAQFTIAGEELDAPAGTFVYISDPLAERSAVAKAAGHRRALARRLGRQGVRAVRVGDGVAGARAMIARVWVDVHVGS